MDDVLVGMRTLSLSHVLILYTDNVCQHHLYITAYNKVSAITKYMYQINVAPK